MGSATAIAWTDKTFNPWWGCSKVSPACDHCYAETFAKRTGHDVWGKDGDRRFFGDPHWNEPLAWNRQAEAAGRPSLVFCASMTDVFEDREDLDEPRARLWSLIEHTPYLVWQLLTKRPQFVLDLIPERWTDSLPANVWIGTTVEDQAHARVRIPRLIEIPARVRFLSCEPLLGSVDLWQWIGPNFLLSPIHWVIVGGESGPGHRALNLDDARALQRQCFSAGVPFFFKQVGGRTPKAGGDLLDGETFYEFPPGYGR